MYRSLGDNTEWQLATLIFKNIACTYNFVPEFVSYLGGQVPMCHSFRTQMPLLVSLSLVYLDQIKSFIFSVHLV